VNLDAELFGPVIVPPRPFGPFPSGKKKDFLDKAGPKEGEMKLFSHDAPVPACEITADERNPQSPPHIGQSIAPSKKDQLIEDRLLMAQERDRSPYIAPILFEIASAGRERTANHCDRLRQALQNTQSKRSDVFDRSRFDKFGNKIYRYFQEILLE
jgi:hypothetical protein